MKKLLCLALLLMIAVLGIVSCASSSATSPALTTTAAPENSETSTKEDTTMTTPAATSMSTPVVTTTETPVTTAPPTYSLEGKTFMFLGSSVTYGSASGGVSFVDYIQQTYKSATCIKEAVSGTTLVDNGASSYIQRMIRNLDTSLSVNHFICQLSTNDATQNKPLGRVSASRDLEDFNTSTIIGAMEYIICYAQTTWGCHVSFYTGTKYDSALYERMIQALYDLQEKWGIGIIDLWNDPEMNAVSQALYSRYMSDPIHPTALGYKKWWTPKFIEHLEKFE